MNHAYRLVYNESTRHYVPAPETSRTRGKYSGKSMRTAARAALAAAGCSALLTGLAQAQTLAPDALPTGGQVVAGQAAILQDGAQMRIQQGSDRAIIDWQQFDIGSAAAVHFQQPSVDSAALNRVIAGDASQIHGQLTANGQVWLVNPNGVIFGEGSRVDVGGLVTSTLNITNQDFLDGKAVFAREGATGSIINQGAITAADGGLVALLAPTVINDGIITARMGNVVLAAGEQVTLDAGANGLLQVAVDPATVQTLVDNRQLIVADGGQAIMTGKAADSLAASVVANSGIVQARTLAEHNGRILLLGDMNHGTVAHSGLLDAGAPDGGDGGFIETSAATVRIGETARVTTHAPQGQTGTWLIDPSDYTIAASGGDMTGAQLSTNLAGSNIEIQSSSGSNTSGEGDIHVNDNINWNTNTLTLTAARHININAVMVAAGDSKLVMNTGTANGGDDAAASGQVHVGLAAGSANGFAGRVDFPDRSGTGFLTINGHGYHVLGANDLGVAGDSSNTTLQGIHNNLVGRYALGADIDASATHGWNDGAGFMPIGDGGSNRFSGTFDGLGHVISGLTIERPDTEYVALFGHTLLATLRNVGLSGGGAITGNNYVGGLAGLTQDSTVANSFAANSVTGTFGVGGLVGETSQGSIENSYATGDITGSGYVGGLVGYNYQSPVGNSYATGSVTGNNNVGGLVGENRDVATISNSYATGSVIGNNMLVGGLVGHNDASIVLNTYATGSVRGAYYVGGLVGIMRNALLENSYATGLVTGGSGVGVGGLVGYNDASTVTNSYWVQETTGQTNSSGGAAIHSLAALQAALPAGFDQAVWANATNQSTPYLRDSSRSLAYITSDPGTASLYDIIQNVAQLQTVGHNLSGRYALGNHIDASATATWNSDGSGGHHGFAPIGNDIDKFSGSFDGLGHVINHLTIKRKTEGYVGLFGYAAADATIRNIGLANAAIEGRSASGILAGALEGTVARSWTSGTLDIGGASGGLVGSIGQGGRVVESYSTATVTAHNGWSDPGWWNDVGGLAGYNSGIIERSYATGAVTGNWGVGGLVGSNLQHGHIQDSYATGNTVGGSYAVGGLVGLNWSGAYVSTSYSTGQVNGTGGLIGSNNNSASNISNSFWDVQASGKSSSSGGTGLTTAQMQDPFTFIDAGWDFNTVWAKSSVNESNGHMMLSSVQSGTFHDSYLRVGALSRTYGAANPDLSSVTTAVGGAGVDWGSAMTGTTPVGTYAWTTADVLSITGGANRYEQLDAGLTITPKVLDTGLTANNKVYDGVAGATLDGTPQLSGVINGDNVWLGGTVTSALFEDVNTGTGKTVVVQGLALGGADRNNYTLGRPDALTLSADITPAALNVAAKSTLTKTYGDTYAFAASDLDVTGLQNSETIGSVDFASDGAAASAAVNGGTPYSVAVSNASGGTFNAANYTITYSDGSLTITPKALAVTALDAAKTHDGIAWSGGNGIRLDGLVNGETQDALSGALAYGGNSQGAIDAGRYKITPYGLFSDNYVINFLDGLLNILPAPQPQLPAPNPTIPSGGNLWATSGLYAQDPTEIPPEIRLALDQNGAPGRGGIPYLAIEDDSVALGIRHSGEASGE